MLKMLGSTGLQSFQNPIRQQQLHINMALIKQGDVNQQMFADQ